VSGAALSAAVLVGPPGTTVGCDVLVTNTTPEVAAVDVRLAGPAAAWGVVLPSALVVAAGATAMARVELELPRAQDLAGSSRPFTVEVVGRDGWGPPLALAGGVEIAEIEDLRASITPLVARARRATTHRLTVDNRGTAARSLRLVPIADDDDLRIRLAADLVEVGPGEQASVEVTVAGRRPSFARRSRPHPFAVALTNEDGAALRAAATHFQDPVPWLRGAVALLALAVAVVLVLSTGRHEPRRSVAAATPVTAAVVAATCPEAGAGRIDIAGFAFCPVARTVTAGAEIVWVNDDLSPHTVTFDDALGSGTLAPGRSWSTTFTQPGVYAYYCRFHPGMAGTVVVGA
jgi:plastocyanin